MAEPVAVPDPRASSRRRVLRLVADAGRPLDVAELAELTGLHPNTLRGHLQLLVDLGELERLTEDRATPGRPRVLYRAKAEVPDDPYRLLAAELASGIAHSHGDDPAEAAGRHWGRRLREAARLDDVPHDAATVTALAARGLDQLGFASTTEPLGDRLYLTQCPFIELARENRSVCAVHAGLLRGLFAELGGEIELDRLDVFVRPDLCVAHLRRPTTPAETPDSRTTDPEASAP
jgi:predicted ArsR family transcriptional regulator